MTTVKVYELLRKRVLVTRQSARQLGPVLAAAVSEDPGDVELDFEGVEGITPSFLDETLALVEEHLRATNKEQFCVRLLHPPTRLSSKFAAAGRGRSLSIRESEDGAWFITRDGEPLKAS